VVFSDGTVVIPDDSMAIYAVLNSEIHNCWAWKYGSTLGASTLRYTPLSVLTTFPINESFSKSGSLDSIGNQLNDHRKSLMHKSGLGLTKLYNIFHSLDLTSPEVASGSTQILSIFQKGELDILKLRELHRDMDNAVLTAYGWDKESAYGPPIDLRHDFYEVEYLPEDDRVRYTIHPDARREALKRLLKLNHERHEEEVKAGLWEKKAVGKKITQKQKDTGKQAEDMQQTLVMPEATLIHDDKKFIPFHIVQPKKEDLYRTCVPQYDIEAAAGPFGDFQQPSIKAWLGIEDIPITNRMFVIQVVGDSMEPVISKGSYCLFEKIFLTPTDGKILFIQYRQYIDPETGGRYAVKKCEIIKGTDDFGEPIVRTRLVSLNPKSPVKELRNEDEITGMAEFIGVLRNE
jgi:phage repressor protein C with HTH and peptisase S24 domain